METPLHFTPDRLYLHLVPPDKLPSPDAAAYSIAEAARAVGDARAIAYDFDAQLHFVREDWLNQNPSVDIKAVTARFTSPAAKAARAAYRENARKAKAAQAGRGGAQDRPPPYIAPQDRIPLFIRQFDYTEDGRLLLDLSGRPQRTTLVKDLEQNHGVTLQWLPHGYHKGVMGHFVASREELQHSPEVAGLLRPYAGDAAAKAVLDERQEIAAGQVSKQAAGDPAAFRAAYPEPKPYVFEAWVDPKDPDWESKLSLRDEEYLEYLWNADATTLALQHRANKKEERRLRRILADMEAEMVQIINDNADPAEAARLLVSYGLQQPVRRPSLRSRRDAN